MSVKYETRTESNCPLAVWNCICFPSPLTSALSYDVASNVWFANLFNYNPILSNCRWQAHIGLLLIRVYSYAVSKQRSVTCFVQIPKYYNLLCFLLLIDIAFCWFIQYCMFKGSRVIFIAAH